MATTKQSPRPSTMKAVRIHNYGDASKLTIEQEPLPAIQSGQVLVQIRYAGLNPVDWKIRSGQRKDRVKVEFPLTMGQDFAGEVVGTGEDAAEFMAGDRVFGFADGSYAEYVAAPISTITAIPESMDFVAAAALPTAGVTALQAIRDFVQAKPSMRILIHAAAGGVGSFASQIAKDRGAEVFGTATGEDLEYLRSLGLAGAIDYKSERFEEKVSGLDAVVDLVGGKTQEHSYAVIKKGGVLVSTVGIMDQGAAQRAGVRAEAMVMKRQAADLEELGEMVLRGAVKPRIGRIMNLDQARQAHETSESGQSHGKLLLKVE